MESGQCRLIKEVPLKKWYLNIGTQELRNTDIHETVSPKREKAREIKPLGILEEKLQDQQGQIKQTKTEHTKECVEKQRLSRSFTAELWFEYAKIMSVAEGQQIWE